MLLRTHNNKLTSARVCLQFLCDGLEQDVAMRKAGLSTTELLTVASGKMLLLHKLLPKLRCEGHKASSPYSVSCARYPACMTLS